MEHTGHCYLQWHTTTQEWCLDPIKPTGRKPQKGIIFGKNSSCSIDWTTSTSHLHTNQFEVLSDADNCYGDCESKVPSKSPHIPTVASHRTLHTQTTWEKRSNNSICFSSSSSSSDKCTLSSASDSNYDNSMNKDSASSISAAQPSPAH
jgi:hypothetical protein